MFDDNKSEKINEWLNSKKYMEDMEKLCNDIIRECEVSENEASTASIFENKIYDIINQNTGIKIKFQKEKSVSKSESIVDKTSIPCVYRVEFDENKIQSKKEQYEDDIVQNRMESRKNGRVDSIVNGLLIEYKHHSKLDYKKAVKQVESYLKGLKDEKNFCYNAILTDGIHICYFSFHGDEVKSTNLYNLTKEDFDLIIRSILANNSKKFVPENILKDFSISVTSNSDSKRLALILFDLLKNHRTEKTEMLFTEWKRLVHFSSEDNGKGNDIEKRRKDLSLIFSEPIKTPENEYMALFALQTVYAIIVKLIACKVIDKIEGKDGTKSFHNLSNVLSDELQEFFEKIEEGYSYQYHNIINFLEGDFFSWYSDKNQWTNELFKEIKLIIKKIDEYSAFSLNVYYEPIDIFKDLYMSIIPKSIRHSMGEYYTPKWLADYVVNEALMMNPKEKWKAIDPCCGSGIFLISLIKHIVGDRTVQRMTTKEKDSIKKEILERVYGVDINPLSVLTARVGYYLALRPFGDIENVEIPVYLGDSAILAEKQVIDDIECYKYSIENEKETFDVVFPVRFVKSKEFSTVMNSLQFYVINGNQVELSNEIIEKYNSKERTSEELLDRVKQMAVSLTSLYVNKWDNIWIRIASNYMKVARLSNFDIIIGNPPWVKWEHLPNVYANKIKEVCNIKHIFSKRGQYGGTQLNLCALIANVTATNWLAKDGVLAFLMPDSIMSQNSYEEFRDFYLDYERNERLYLQKIDRWQAPLRPFRCDNKPITQDFNTYYYSRQKVDYKKGIPVKSITRNKNVNDQILNAHENFKSVEKYLMFNQYKAMQLSDETTAFSYSSEKYDFSKIIGNSAYKYRTGVEFTPQEVFLLKGAGESSIEGNYRFYNKKFTQAKYTMDEDDIPNNGWDFPTEIIYPIITGPHIEAFKYNSNNEYCILPYEKSNTKTPIPIEVMNRKHRNIFKYLTAFRDKIDKQSEKSKKMRRGNENDFYALSKIGPYTFAKYIVAARDNSKFCASVIYNQKTPWGEEKNTICVKHTIIISQDLSGRFIDEDEAHYICGILNSEIVQQYIQNSFKSNGYSLNKAKIYIPLYDRSNALHREISEMAKRSSEQENINLSEIQHKLMELYVKICEARILF